jgi:hypothetical protein
VSQNNLPCRNRDFDPPVLMFYTDLYTVSIMKIDVCDGVHLHVPGFISLYARFTGKCGRAARCGVAPRRRLRRCTHIHTHTHKTTHAPTHPRAHITMHKLKAKNACVRVRSVAFSLLTAQLILGSGCTCSARMLTALHIWLGRRFRAGEDTAL